MINVEDFKDPSYLMAYYLSINSRLAALELAVKNLTATNSAMVPCPWHDDANPKCYLLFNHQCGKEPCRLSAQHQ